MQLVNDQIFLLQIHKDNLIVDAEKVRDHFGVRPDQMLDLLAIMGDASDSIPGLEGFGPKTASSLLQELAPSITSWPILRKSKEKRSSRSSGRSKKRR